MKRHRGWRQSPQRKKQRDRGWRDWYQLERWRSLSRAQRRAQPLCAACFAKGKITAATIADHIEPHKGNWQRFILGSLQSLCDDCHREKHQVDLNAKRKKKKLEFGLDGWPIETDADHSGLSPDS